MSLKEIVREKFISQVIRPIKPENGFKVLVLDQHSMNIMSSCCRMFDLIDEGVTLVENLAMKRKPLPQLEAIYFVSPTKESFDRLIADFSSPYEPQYAKAHLFTTSDCPDELFQSLSSQVVSHFLGTFEEVNIEFMPIEANAFVLDAPDAFHTFYSPKKPKADRDALVESVARQLATVCVTLGEDPVVRYTINNPINEQVANALVKALDQHRKNGLLDKATNGLLMISDRSIDALSPLLHETTYQAMVHDLLPVDKDVYEYEFKDASNQKRCKKVILGEQDSLWPGVRHLFISDAILSVTQGFKEFVSKSKAGNLSKGTVSVQELSEALKAMPQHQEKMQRYQLHIHIAEKCMECLKRMEPIVIVEQNMVMGATADGSKVKSTSFASSIVPILQDQTVSIEDKLRVVMIYSISAGSVKESSREVLLDHARIPQSDRATVDNLRHVGVRLNPSDPERKQLVRKEHSEEVYNLSRWVPVVRDLLDYMVSDKVDGKYFFGLASKKSGSGSGGSGIAGGSGSGGASGSGAGGAAGGVGGEDDGGAPVSLRTTKPGWATKSKEKKAEGVTGGGKGKQDASRVLPRTLLFLIGGATYSELRSCYEVDHKANTSKVIIGATSVFTPNAFLRGLNSLDKDGSTAALEDEVTLDMQQYLTKRAENTQV